MSQDRKTEAPAPQSFYGKGAEVLELPSIRTQALEDQTALYQALNHISDYQWAVFTSPTGAEIFLDELKRRRMDIRSLAGIRLAAIGQGTRKILEDRGLLTDLMPEIYDGDCLGETLAKELKGGERILIPRARKGNENRCGFLRRRRYC